MWSGREQGGFEPDGDDPASRLDWIRRRLHALGRTPCPGSGLTVQRFVTLAEIARIDGALVRLAEGHLDALAIKDELGVPSVPSDEGVWAVWAARPELLAAEPNGSGWRLCGVKPWCSGAAGVDRALVTATDPSGRVRLFDVDVDEMTFDDDWRPMGMRASASHTGHVDLRVPGTAQLGPVGGYVERAGFWHGGIGVAACWNGLAQRLAADLRIQAGRGDDPYVQAASGRAAGSVAAATALLAAAGRQIDDEPEDVPAARRRAQLVRVAVAGLAQTVLDESVTAQGAGALCFDGRTRPSRRRPHGVRPTVAPRTRRRRRRGARRRRLVVVVTGWSGPPLVGERLVVVAPHPDDEILCAGGLMRWTARSGREVVVVAVTDGEGSHARSTAVTPDELRARRADERTEALARMGIPATTVVRLGVPDRSCAGEVDAIAAALSAVLRDRDLVVGPSCGDRHPDHVAVAAAVSIAAPPVADDWWEAPTWALVHGTAAVPVSVLALDEMAWAAKQHAMAAYRSQLAPLGPGPTTAPSSIPTS